MWGRSKTIIIVTTFSLVFLVFVFDFKELGRNKLENSGKSRKVFVVGMATIEDRHAQHYCYSIATILTKGYNLTLYGKGTYPNDRGYSGLQMNMFKVMALINFLNTSRAHIKDEDLIIFTDTKDVSYLQPPESFREAYERVSTRKKKKVFYLAERNLLFFLRCA